MLYIIFQYGWEPVLIQRILIGLEAIQEIKFSMWKQYLNNKLVDEDILSLSHPMDSIKTLPLCGRIPGWIQQQEMVGSGQI